jgi:uncharacterized protein YecE (DUF72 family)
MGRFRVGTSGYDYPHWKGTFYPDSLPRSEWFSHYASVFDTVEINATFYGLPAAAVVDAWRARAPAGFVYALKFSRYGTHMKHLRDPATTIPPFLERARRLDEHLGPILVQLPPHWRADPERLAAFLQAAPSDLRWAVELRDPRWLQEEVYAVLRRARAALCIHDMIEKHPRIVTTDWIYLRYHGNRYTGGYSHQRLTADAERIADWTASGLDVYAYFNNDAAGLAVINAGQLGHYVTTRCLA